MRTLSAEEARTFYDRFGSKQDRQAFYEAPALERLVANSDFGAARSVFEFGCGTGRFAEELLRHHLPSDARYAGVDISTTMIDLASRRLAALGTRASVLRAGAAVRFPVEDASVDRVVSSYVLDLLPEERIREMLAESARVLRPGGLACLVGLTSGTTVASRALMAAWTGLFRVNPAWVGGCRPLELARMLEPRWRIVFREVVVAWAIPSEVTVAAVPESR